MRRRRVIPLPPGNRKASGNSLLKYNSAMQLVYMTGIKALLFIIFALN